MTNIKKCLLDHGFKIVDEDTITVYRREEVEVMVAFDLQHPEWAWWQVYVMHVLSDNDVKRFGRSGGRSEFERSFQRGDNLVIDTFMDLGALEDPWGETEEEK